MEVFAALQSPDAQARMLQVTLNVASLARFEVRLFLSQAGQRPSKLPSLG